MKTKLALLQYTFLFDPSKTWQHAYQFEQDLTDFLAAHGKEANFISTVEGSTGSKILFIQPLETMPTPPNPVGRPKTFQGVLRDVRKETVTAKERDFKKGTLVPTKGYLKK